MLWLLCVANAVLAGADAAKRNPTREQPHVVLESRSLNTFHAPAFHEDAFAAAPGVPHEYIVQLAAPIVDAKQRIGEWAPRACVRACVRRCAGLRATGRAARRAPACMRWRRRTRASRLSFLVDDARCVCAPCLRAATEASLGVKFSNYLPHNSYLLYVTEDVAHRVREQTGVLWVGAFLPEFKVRHRDRNSRRRIAQTSNLT